MPGSGSAADRSAAIPLAEAAHRAGVHPNAVRRLVERGDLTAKVLRTGEDETWLVDPEAVARRLRLPRRAPPAPPSEPEAGRAPAAAEASTTAHAPALEIAVEPASGSTGSRPASELPAMVDLSLDRAQALERYTHGLLAPLVDLLREREAAIERREAIVREQAERIGRLEREVELLRLQVARAGDLPIFAPTEPADQAQAAPDAVEAAPFQEADLAPAPPEVNSSPPVDEAAGAALDTAMSSAAAFSRQVEQLRGDLRAIATRLEGEATSSAEAAPAVPSEPPPVEPPVAELGVALNHSADLDPFASAEVAVRELQQALAAWAPQQTPEATDEEGMEETTRAQAADSAELAPPTSAGGAVMAIPAPAAEKPQEQEPWPAPESAISPAEAAALRQSVRREPRGAGWRSWRWWRRFL